MSFSLSSRSTIPYIEFYSCKYCCSTQTDVLATIMMNRDITKFSVVPPATRRINKWTVQEEQLNPLKPEAICRGRPENGRKSAPQKSCTVYTFISTSWRKTNMRKAFHRQCSRRLSGKGLRAAGLMAGRGVAGSSWWGKGSDALGGPLT